MGKKILDLVLDRMLAEAEGDRVFVCTAEPTNYTEASVTYELATENVVGGDFVKAAGDVSGRKSTCSPSAGTVINNTGTATHVVIADSGSTEVRRIHTCTSQLLTAGNGATVDIGALVHEIEAAA